MIYQYKCIKCKKLKEVEIPMGDDLPVDILCDCGKEMKHDFMSQVRSQAIEIPQSFQACSRYTPKIKYTKDSSTERLM